MLSAVIAALSRVFGFFRSAFSVGRFFATGLSQWSLFASIVGLRDVYVGPVFLGVLDSYRQITAPLADLFQLALNISAIGAEILSDIWVVGGLFASFFLMKTRRLMAALPIRSAIAVTMVPAVSMLWIYVFANIGSRASLEQLQAMAAVFVLMLPFAFVSLYGLLFFHELRHFEQGWKPSSEMRTLLSAPLFLVVALVGVYATFFGIDQIVAYWAR
ncbi:MAG: hypothetical protein AAFR65_06500 [Pseudomonadota bacterium]